MQEPLRKIQTLANRILEKESETLTKNGKDYFGRMQSAAARMQQLIQDLLAFSRVNTSERVLESTDLNAIVAEVLVDLEEDIDEKQAVIDSPPYGVGVPGGYEKTPLDYRAGFIIFRRAGH